MMRYIFVVLLFALAAGLFFFYVGPTYSGIQALQAQNAQYSQALSEAAQLDQTYQSLLSRYNSFDPTDISRLQELLPDQVNNIQLILDLSNLAQTDGMPLQNVDVQTPDDSAADQNAPGAIGAGDPYGSLTLSFTTQGSYQDFEQFINDLQSSLRIVDLESLSITPSGGGSSGIYQYAITLQTYWLK